MSKKKRNIRSRYCNPIHKKKTMDLKRRLFVVLSMGVSFYFIVYFVLLKNIPFDWGSLVFIICTFFFSTEVIFLFDKLIDRKYPWHKLLKKRLLILVLFSFFWLFFMSSMLPYIEMLVPVRVEVDKELYNLIHIVGILYMINYVSITIARNHHNSLVYFMMENDKLKKEKMENDYKQLKDQLNPHFLFNNLSTLIAIIRSDKKMAIEFAENFTDVYRYVLDNKDKDIVTLKEEVCFLNSYITLHKARIGEGLSVEVDIDKETLGKRIPYLSLQILVENAIKHNITSRSKPLTITINGKGDQICVSNNRQLKESTYSTKTGLTNLSERMYIICGKDIEVVEEDDIFKVTVPLIS